MNIATGIILGAIQGFAEFLPISSSGHLIIARELFGLTSENGMAFDAVLQLGTLLALVIFFRADLWRLIKTFFVFCLRKPVDATERTLLGAMVIGTIPALILGLALEKYMDSVFRSALVVAITLLIGSVLFEIAERFAKQHAALTVKRGFFVGCFQTLALVPGISRSGATISGGLLLGLTREQAARFSFLLSFPIILGTGLKKLYDLVKHGDISGIGPELAVGCVTAFVIGYFCIAFLLKYLRTHSLRAFIWYRVLVACVVFAVLAMRG
jgi:undecaprenyl-diphosphatase